MVRKPIVNGTVLVHGDGAVAGSKLEVAPSISVTTTFRTPEAGDAQFPTEALEFRSPARHVYSRYTQDVSTRAEHILSKINHGFAITYSSGLSASYAALVALHPKRIAIREGYHGCHETIKVYEQARGSPIPLIDLDDEYQPGDICWLETPLNPTGESRDIKYYADKIHKVGGKLLVDSTFGPPPLQYPFKFGADYILHSGTKYFGGHSDLLAGILVVNTKEEWAKLWHNRTFTGNTLGNLEAWLLLRSLRTLHLRVPRQSETATKLAQWLNAVALTPPGKSYDGVPGGTVTKVWHSSLQGKDQRGFEPSQQMEGGYNATFSIMLNDPEQAEKLQWVLKYFVPATSLGGVESLIERRINSDTRADPRLIRLSIGVEEFEDLRDDLRQALQTVAQPKAKL
ncbi:cystathionine gamma-synthase [Coprinopsis cinerea okayama7|uniref:Cystathionine gamma-synthase n=1 Tax=Coprinopsis cinerea (strain Okayama-7 / 130 / ATCC MYA-4618 / FGSC 9003) TaxID=240176 RepID=D6RMQ3_COPC7|nr:cystathionine gamma-synthase [Coprinopsis cinerea okayama7\|eukprot:XP_002911180.1 cystathionine gamma-synthase [Coprinopsis cinerea okayama7\